MNLNPTIEQFYLRILDYADLKIEDDVIVSKNKRIGEFTVDGKQVALPYFELLKNPMGKMFFHPLNENYTTPENAVFNNYRDMLSFVINVKLAHAVVVLITLASEPQLQQKVKSGKLINLVAAIGEADLSTVENFQKVLKAALGKNKYAPLIEIFLKKNGEINDIPYAAIGKINFKFFEELKNATEASEKGYSIFDVKVRKKDVLLLYSVMEAIFPNIDTKDYYVEGTNNKIFRYLNVLLKTSYLITSRLKEIAELIEPLNEISLAVEELNSNHEWVNDLESLYEMAKEIRLIPNQVDINTEAKRIKVDETKAMREPEAAQAPSFNPNLIPQPCQPTVPQPHQLTPEEIIRGNMQPQMNTMYGNMAPMGMPLYNPTMVTMQQQPVPSWVQTELLKEQQAKLQQQQGGTQVTLTPLQQQMLQQQMAQQQQMLQQQMLQQQMLQQQLAQQQLNPMFGGIQQQPGLQLNPHFSGQVNAPWN